MKKIWTDKRIDKEFTHFASLPYALQFRMVNRFLKQDKGNWSYFKTLLQIWLESEE